MADDVYWIEGRASEGGRSVIVRRSPDGEINDVTPPGFNVRTRVHEYGGGAYTVDEGTIYFSNFADQRIYRQQPGKAPVAITDEGPFFADYRVDRLPQPADCAFARRRSRGASTRTIWWRSATPDRRARAGAGRRRRLLLGSDRQPRRKVSRLAAMASPEHAVGRHRAVGRGVQRRRQRRLAGAGCGRRQRIDLSTRMVA